MTVFVVCKEQLVAGLLRGCLEQAGLGPVEIRGGLDHLPENDSDATVLLHDNQPADDIHDRIVAHRARAPRHRFILVTRDPLPDGEAERLESLVSAMLTSDCTSDALVGAVSVVRAGFHLTRDAGAAYAAPPPAAQPRPARPVVTEVPPAGDAGHDVVPEEARRRLSEREHAILRKLTSGVSNKDIAKDLGICESTVKVHLRTCYRKIGARNRTQAAMWAAEFLQDRSG